MTESPEPSPTRIAAELNYRLIRTLAVAIGVLVVLMGLGLYGILRIANRADTAAQRADQNARTIAVAFCLQVKITRDALDREKVLAQRAASERTRAAHGRSVRQLQRYLKQIEPVANCANLKLPPNRPTARAGRENESSTVAVRPHEDTAGGGGGGATTGGPQARTRPPSRTSPGTPTSPGTTPGSPPATPPASGQPPPSPPAPMPLVDLTLPVPNPSVCVNSILGINCPR